MFDSMEFGRQHFIRFIPDEYGTVFHLKLVTAWSKHHKIPRGW